MSEPVFAYWFAKRIIRELESHDQVPLDGFRSVEPYIIDYCLKINVVRFIDDCAIAVHIFRNVTLRTVSPYAKVCTYGMVTMCFKPVIVEPPRPFFMVRSPLRMWT